MSQSVVTEDVIDVYQMLGLEQPDLSILSDDFLKDVEGLKQKCGGRIIKSITQRTNQIINENECDGI